MKSMITGLLSKFLQINPLQNINVAALLIVIAAINPVVALAQSTYETNITTTNWLENFDEIGNQHKDQPYPTNIPAGWVMAVGDPLPQYGVSLNLPGFSSSNPQSFTSLGVPDNTQSAWWIMDGSFNSALVSGSTVNFGDASTGETNRAIGFGSSSPSWQAPTNYIMFGFTNGNNQTITNISLTYNIKCYEINTASSTGSQLYYSYDGTNWTHVGGANVGPFPTATSRTYYTTNAGGPLISNVVVSINNLAVPVGNPFYLCWQFVIATSTGSGGFYLGLDDVNLGFGLGNPAGPTLTFDWPSGAGNWNTASDWLGNTLPTSPANLIFSGSGGSMVNNLNSISTGSGSIGYLYFSNTVSGSYTLTGNGITTGAGITNDSSFIQTINIPLTFSADNNFGADNADFIFGGAINLGVDNLFLNGQNNYTFNSSISGSGNVTMNSGANLNLNAANSYTGATIINQGTLQTGNAAAIPPNSAVTVGSGANINLNTSEKMGALNGYGNVNMVNGNCNITISPTSSQSGDFFGTISGTANFIMAGTGTQIFEAVNTYTGSTTISNGTLSIPATAVISSGNGPLILAGGTLQCSSTRDENTGILSNAFFITANSTIDNNAIATGNGADRYLPFGSTVTTTPGTTLTIANIATGNYSNLMVVRFMAGGFNFSSGIAFNNSLAAHPTNEFCQLDSYNTNGTTQTYSGTISGPGILRRGALNGVLGGGGITILTGQNTYTGEPNSPWAPHCTYLESGLVGFGSSSVTNTNGAVISGPVGVGDFFVNAGDPYLGIFASGGAQTVANHIFFNGTTNTPAETNALIITGVNALTLTGTMDVGATLTKTFLVSNTALTTISGVIYNPASIIKDGPGTLALSGINTYGGNTSNGFGTMIVNGDLEVDSISGSGVGTNAVLVEAPGTLSGTGIVGGPVSGQGSIAPGSTASGPGTLTLTNGLDLSSGGTYVWELGANSTSTSYSVISLTGGNLNAGGSATLSINFGGTATAPNSTNTFWQTAHTWVIVSVGGSASNSGSTKFTSILNGTYAAGKFTTSISGSSIVLNYQPTFAVFEKLYDAGPGFTSGENLILTNQSGLSLYVWSSSSTSVAVSNWTTVGQMQEQPLNDGSGNSRYSINVTPSVSPTYVLAGNTNAGPYVISPVPVTTLTTANFSSYTVASSTASISAVGILTLQANAPSILPNVVYSNTGFQLQFNASSGANYTIQASTNLTTWTNIASGTVSSSPVTYKDTSATSYSKRFYRVVIP